MPIASIKARSPYIALTLLAFACSNRTPTPESPAQATAPAEPRPAVGPKETTTPAESAAADTHPAPPAADSAKPVDEPRDGLRKASRPPLELLTGNNVVYVLNYAGSKIGEAAKERCEGEHADDRAQARQCLTKEREKVAIESARFVKDPQGQYWWVTYNRYKGNLLKWHKIQFLPGKEDGDSITLNLTGKDKGIAPMPKVPALLKIELPNDYSIVVSDPQHGALVYDAKIGLMDQE
jgi:hypothetical protein